MDDAVHDWLGNGASGVRIGINACIPALRLVLGTENYGALAAGLHDFQQIVGLLWREGPDEPLVQDQQVHLLVGGQTFLQLASASGNTQLVEAFGYTNIADLLETAAGGVTQSTGNVGLAVAGSAFEDDVAALVHKFAGGESCYTMACRTLYIKYPQKSPLSCMKPALLRQSLLLPFLHTLC